MRQVHKAGEKCFVDYSGDKLTIVDRATGDRVEVELFVAVMGASNYTSRRRRRSGPLTGSRATCDSSNFSADHPAPSFPISSRAVS
jgi:transposase